MRMRRKRNLDERVEACNHYFIKVEKDVLNVKKALESTAYIDLKNVFGNSNPIELEIGCGKGKFICETAKKHPEKNFLAVEMLKNVIIAAAEAAKENGIENVRFINTAAEYLPRYIPEKSISVIYLNFSCPYPKKTYANRRLTNPVYLEAYKKIMCSGGLIVQKTDNKDFFEYSLKQYAENGFEIKNISYDLHAENGIENVITEYESKFIDKGASICRLEAQIY